MSSACICSRPDIISLADGLCCNSCGYFHPCTTGSSTLSWHDGPNYDYKPLWPANAIRLILLGGDRDESLRCRIFHTTLSQHPDFEALSYTWGDVTLSHTINTPEGSISVTQNCVLALRDLRYPDKDRLLWIDAMCINQSSSNEKNHQVPLMRAIYTAAKRVVVHIGPDFDKKADRVFNLFHNFDMQEMGLRSQSHEITSPLAPHTNVDLILSILLEVHHPPSG